MFTVALCVQTKKRALAVWVVECRRLFPVCGGCQGSVKAVLLPEHLQARSTGIVTGCSNLALLPYVYICLYIYIHIHIYIHIYTTSTYIYIHTTHTTLSPDLSVVMETHCKSTAIVSLPPKNKTRFCLSEFKTKMIGFNQ